MFIYSLIDLFIYLFLIALVLSNSVLPNVATAMVGLMIITSIHILSIVRSNTETFGGKKRREEKRREEKTREEKRREEMRKEETKIGKKAIEKKRIEKRREKKRQDKNKKEKNRKEERGRCKDSELDTVNK